MDFNQFAALVEKPTKMDVTVAIFALKRREINVGAFGIQMENVEEKTYAFFLNNEMVCFFFNFENVNTRKYHNEIKRINNCNIYCFFFHLTFPLKLGKL